MPLKQKLYDSVEQLNADFARRIADILTAAINVSGTASLVVSGGRTPQAMFNTLSKMAIDWSKVSITLADERWVGVDDPASNEAMVKSNLLVNHGAAATFIGLKTAHDDARDAIDECSKNLNSIKTPFDVLILGMGEDGHTASLFPCSEQISQGLDLSNDAQYIAVQPTTAPNQRMSLTLKALLNSKNVFLHLTGTSKKQVLETVLADEDELAMPIRAVIHRTNVELVWAP